MFCPRCGSTQSEELKFCKACGANLFAVRQVIDTRDSNQKFDWSNTWVAEMFMSGDEALRRQEELERRRGITPATRRYQEIKAGVITSSVGLGVAAFLSIFMEGIIRRGKVTAAAAEILNNLWVVGVIHLLGGIALIINGSFLSLKIMELWKQHEEHGLDRLEGEGGPHMLRSADTQEFAPSNFSVTEGTTKHLGGSSHN